MRRKSILSILSVLLVFALRFGYSYIKYENNQRQKEIAESVQKIGNSIQQPDNSEFLKSILESSNKYNEQKLGYDEYIPIDGSYSLGIKESKYYIFDVENQTESLLENVTNAYVLNIKDEDYSEEIRCLFIQKDGNWYLVDEKAEAVIVDLNGVEVTEDSKFVIKDDSLWLDEE